MRWGGVQSGHTAPRRDGSHAPRCAFRRELSGPAVARAVPRASVPRGSASARVPPPPTILRNRSKTNLVSTL